MTTLSSELFSALIAAIGSFIALSIAWKKGFFRLLHAPDKPQQLPTLLLVAIAFGLYIAVSMFIPASISPFILQGANTQYDRIARVTLFSFLVSFVTLIAFALLLRWMPQPVRQTILLKNPPFQPKKDLLEALAAWVISFPVVLFIGSTLEILLYFHYGTFELPDQVAVLFFKMTLGKPLYLAMALISIVVFSPLVEETLFRGFLQSWLRRHRSPTASIAITSACFTAFHFSTTQGASNIPILAALFVLGCFLGLLYERRQSLFAPLLLHILFNAVNVANLYLADSSS